MGAPDGSRIFPVPAEKLSIERRDSMALWELLRQDDRAADFYNSLHQSVRAAVDERAGEIVFDEDLYAIANNAMTESLNQYGEIFDDD